MADEIAKLEYKKLIIACEAGTTKAEHDCAKEAALKRKDDLLARKKLRNSFADRDRSF